MSKAKQIFLLMLFLLFPIMLHASLEKNYKKMNMQNGLAGNSVYSIFKDKDGFIWFGTGDGLSRYDGKNIRSFTSDKYNMTIEYMYDTSDGLLLFITNSNLHCFDRYRECFVETGNFRDKRYYNTKGLVLLNDSTYWSISKNKLHLLKRVLSKNPKNKERLFSLEVLKEFALTDEQEVITKICSSPDKKKLFLITKKSSLLIFDVPSGKLETTVKLYASRTDSYQISSLVCDKDYLWMATIGGGVLRYHLQSHTLDSFTNNSPKEKPDLSHNDVYAITAVGDEYMAATWNGYTVLSVDKKSGETTTEINNQLAYLYNFESRMLAVYYDSRGLVYFGTHGGGVIVLDLRKQFYERFSQGEINEICDIVSDDEGYVWLATFNGTIMRSTLPFEQTGNLDFVAKRMPVAEGKAALCAMKDEDGNLWFGNSDASITCYQSSSGKFVDYNLPPEYRKNNNLKYSTYVWQLFIDSKHRFWVGTRNGLLLFDRETTNFSPVLTVSDNLLEKCSIRAIAEGINGELWLGTPDGLYQLSVDTRTQKVEVKGDYEVKAGIGARYVRALLASGDGQLYVGYTDGLGVLSESGDSIQHFYTTHDGMCSNFVTCIAEDEKGYVWLGTNSGISRYSRQLDLFYNYYISGSNRSVLHIGKTLFFGNNYALTYFNPEAVETVPRIKKNLLLDLEVNNKLVAIGEKVNGQVLLEKGLPYTDKIVLAYANRDFSLSFSNLLYSEENQKYNYRLLPYQNEWVVCNGGEKASYTNLPAGDYVFEVKSVYADSSNNIVNMLAISIQPHWSQTIWFRLGVCMVLILITGYGIYRVRQEQRRAKRELLLKHELHISHIECEKEKQIREERENFFTCVAHELRTPLTLVLSPLQELLHRKKKDDPDYKALSLMYENGNSLHRLVDDLLSVQKIEAGMIKLCLSEVNIIALLKEAADTFRQMAASRKIDFVIDLPNRSIPLWVDVEKVASAVRNLLSNAFKYTEAGGKITLSLVENTLDEKEYCRIVVSDTGRGIPDELQYRVFDSFVTGATAPSFSTKVGIGLHIVKNTMDMHHGTVDLQSELGKGSIFSLNFPKGKAHFADDNYEETVYELASDETNLEKGTSEPEQMTKEDKVAARYKATLLVVEDNFDIRQYIVSLFRSEYNVLEADDGEEGVKLATLHLPDLIISDIMMPIKDGFTCCKEIREQVETAHIPLLMLTAKAEDTDIIKGTQLGVDDYMMKPFNPLILKAKVENLILRRKHLKRIYTKSLMLKQTVQETEGDDFMQKVINIIEANLTNEHFNVQTLATQLNMSQPTLFRKIKERSELSISKVIRSVRMSKAASLITEHKYSILEISEMVGFNDPNTFRKHFTEQFGIPPSKYNEQNKRIVQR